MSNIPEDRKYTSSHEWVKPLDDGTMRVGITDHAQRALGDMVFVELPEVGGAYPATAECAVVESVKSASDLYCPLSGEIVEVNGALNQSPEIVNRDPYGEGWIFRLKPDDVNEMNRLLDPDEYADGLKDEQH